LLKTIQKYVLFQYLIKYWKANFHFQLYLATLAFIATYTAIFYYFDLYFQIIRQTQYLPLKTFYYALFVGFPFIFTCFLLQYFKVATNWWRQRHFWQLLILTLFCFSLSQNINLTDFIKDALTNAQYNYLYRIIYYSKSYLLVLLPLAIYYYLVEQKHQQSKHWFGCTLRDIVIKPYIPLVFVIFGYMSLSVFFSDLQSYYPVLQYSHYQQFAIEMQTSPIITALLFELLYGLNFISVEYVFRGVLLLGFIRFLGPQAMLPMVATYVAVHFGKPLTETVTSLIGGYIVGVFAYYSKQIWGGVILHITLAWSMELFG